MNLIKRLKKHWFTAVIIIASGCISSTYGIINILYIQPKDQEVKRQEKIIREQKEEIATLKKCCDKPCIEYKQEILRVTKKMKECCVYKFTLCKDRAEILKIGNHSFVISIDTFWQQGKRVGIDVKDLSNSRIKQTRPLQAGDIEKVKFGNITYAFIVIWIKDKCIKASFEKL